MGCTHKESFCLPICSTIEDEVILRLPSEHMQKFLDRIYTTTDPLSIAPKLPFYFTLSYFNKGCSTIAKQIKPWKSFARKYSFNSILYHTINTASFHTKIVWHKRYSPVVFINLIVEAATLHSLEVGPV